MTAVALGEATITAAGEGVCGVRGVGPVASAAVPLRWYRREDRRAKGENPQGWNPDPSRGAIGIVA
jgi:hypothetical protein